MLSMSKLQKNDASFLIQTISNRVFCCIVRYLFVYMTLLKYQKQYGMLFISIVLLMILHLFLSIQNSRVHDFPFFEFKKLNYDIAFSNDAD